MSVQEPEGMSPMPSSPPPPPFPFPGLWIALESPEVDPHLVSRICWRMVLTYSKLSKQQMS